MNDAPIDVWFHCWCGNNNFKIASSRVLKYTNDKIEKLKKSGLYNAIKKFYIVAHGINSTNEFIFDDLCSMHSKIEIIKLRNPIIGHEADTLNLMIDKYQNVNENHNVLFFHTKGFSYPESLNHNNWIRHMDFFLIKKWKEHQDILKNHDTSGVFLFDPDEDSRKEGEPDNRKTYAGFFWWAKSDHLKKIKPFTWRMDRGKGGEFGIITQECNFYWMKTDFFPEGFDFHKHVWCDESIFDEGW